MSTPSRETVGVISARHHHSVPSPINIYLWENSFHTLYSLFLYSNFPFEGSIHIRRSSLFITSLQSSILLQNLFHVRTKSHYQRVSRTRILPWSIQLQPSSVNGDIPLSTLAIVSCWRSQFLAFDLPTTHSAGLKVKSSRSRKKVGVPVLRFPLLRGHSGKTRTLEGRFDSVATGGGRQAAFFPSGFLQHLLSGRADEKNKSFRWPIPRYFFLHFIRPLTNSAITNNVRHSSALPR